MDDVLSVGPRTGQATELVAQKTSPTDLERYCMEALYHGGPWPSTNSQHTSVGAIAIQRFLRPVTWQNAPPDLLPAELADDYQGIPRRIDGVLVLP